MHLACPDKKGPLADNISIDIFTTALNEPCICMFVMSCDPTTLENALTHSFRYEAINLGNPEPTHTASSAPSAYVYDDKGRKRDIANIRGAEVQQEAQHHDSVQTALLETQRKLAEREAELEQWQSAWNNEQTRPQAPAVPYDWRLEGRANTSNNRQYPTYFRGRLGRGQGTHNPGYTTGYNQACYNCGGDGHYSRDCVQPRAIRGVRGSYTPSYNQTPAPASAPSAASTPAAGIKLNTVTHPTAIPETYIEVEILNQLHKCLLDTGCDHSIIPRKLVPTATLEPASVDVKAANGSRINILGLMNIRFAVMDGRSPQGGPAGG